MLNNTLPFSKARARCWAGSPVSESYLQGWVRLGGVPTRSWGSQEQPRGSCPPQPLPVEEQPEASGRADKACLQEAELLVIGREQLQAGVAPAGGPRGLPDGSQLGPTAPARPRAHAAAPGMSQLQGVPQGLGVNIVTRALPGVAGATRATPGACRALGREAGQGPRGGHGHRAAIPKGQQSSHVGAGGADTHLPQVLQLPDLSLVGSSILPKVPADQLLRWRGGGWARDFPGASQPDMAEAP